MFGSGYQNRYTPLTDSGRERSGKSRGFTLFNGFLLLVMLSGMIYFMYRIVQLSNDSKSQGSGIGGKKWVGYELGRFDVNPKIFLSEYEKRQIPKTLIPQMKLRIMTAKETGTDSFVEELDHEETHDADGTYGIVEDLFDIGDSPTKGEWREVMQDMSFWIANTDPPVIVPQIKYKPGSTPYMTPESFKDSSQAESSIITQAADAVYNMEDAEGGDKLLSPNPVPGASTFIDIGCDYTTSYMGAGLHSFLIAARGVSSIQCVIPPTAAKRIKLPLILASRLNLYGGHFSVYTARVLNTKKEAKDESSHAGVEGIGGVALPSMHTALLRFSADARVIYDAWKSSARLYSGSDQASQVILPIPAHLGAKDIGDMLETMNRNGYKLHILPSGKAYDSIMKSSEIGARHHSHKHIQTDYLTIPEDKIDNLAKLLSSSKGGPVTVWWSKVGDGIVKEMHHKEYSHYKKSTTLAAQGGHSSKATSQPNNAAAKSIYTHIGK